MCEGRAEMMDRCQSDALFVPLGTIAPKNGQRIGALIMTSLNVQTKDFDYRQRALKTVNTH